MSIHWVAIALAFVFAINIGASGAAASMGIAYGSGAIRHKKLALSLVAVGIFAGAYWGGGEVVKTLSSGIIPSQIMTVQLVIIILLTSTLTLFAANVMGIPLSTSEVTVGSVIGVGVAYQTVYIEKIAMIVFFWICIPLIAFLCAWSIGLFIKRLERTYTELKANHASKWNRLLIGLVIAAGFLEAFSAGMNNVANAIGPIVGAGLLPVHQGTVLGGVFVGLGAIWLGGRVLETNGKKITQLSLLQGFAISTTGGILVVISSLFGIPVPLTQITTTAILGMGTANQGFQIWQKGIISKIIRVWIVSPLITLVMSFALVKIFIEPSPYVIIVLAALFLASWGIQSLYRTIREENRISNEDGAGI